ncbi:hypothetical protein SK128_010639 [Halocaridina rubra]|uniref:Uncharacterized protein n=1 Tax=Halocaridina rubra TaxID=373956 RepID=A0AAN8WYE6_HALRR
MNTMKTLFIFILQTCLLKGSLVSASNMPAELAMMVQQANIDGTCVKPVPITDDVYYAIKDGPFPGDTCGELPCKLQYEDWWCALCAAVWPYCLNTPMKNSSFCEWCNFQGCMIPTIPGNTSEDYPDYFEIDYLNGPFQDPK